ncbi:MAG: B12-binding domain-containing radical SAM protein [Candidatus Promineifilaceae bacterium]
MKLLFIIPPQIIKSAVGIDAQPSINIPLGVLYIAAYLRDQNWLGEIEVYDGRLSAEKTRYGDDNALFGDSWETVAQTIKDFNPDVIGISNMFSWQIDGAIRVSQICKETCPEAITVLGGPHASSFPLDMIREPTIDYLVMGEGEERMYQFLNALENDEPIQIQGILGKEDDFNLLRPNKKAPIDFIMPLDLLPIPAYDLIDMERYFYLQSNGYSPRVREWGKRAVSLLTSRGCPHQCIFCSIQATMGYRFRHHTPEYVRAHIHYLIENYGIDYIHFEDDNFTHDTDRYDEIIDMLLELSPKIPWGTPNGVRADSWNPERIRRTKASGCQYLCIAIESSSQRVINEVIKKRLDLSQVDFVMQECKEVGLPLLAFYVLGLPGETAEEIQGTVDFAIDRYDRFNVYPSFSVANPLPGTELYDIVLEQNLFAGVTAADPPKPNTIRTNEFDPDFIERVHNEALKRKAWITLKKMSSNPQTFKYYVELSWKNMWFFKRTLRSTIDSILGSRD